MVRQAEKQTKTGPPPGRDWRVVDPDPAQLRQLAQGLRNRRKNLGRGYDDAARRVGAKTPDEIADAVGKLKLLEQTLDDGDLQALDLSVSSFRRLLTRGYDVARLSELLFVPDGTNALQHRPAHEFVLPSLLTGKKVHDWFFVGGKTGQHVWALPLHPPIGARMSTEFHQLHYPHPVECDPIGAGVETILYPLKGELRITFKTVMPDLDIEPDHGLHLVDAPAHSVRVKTSKKKIGVFLMIRLDGTSRRSSRRASDAGDKSPSTRFPRS